MVFIDKSADKEVRYHIVSLCQWVVLQMNVTEIFLVGFPLRLFLLVKSRIVSCKQIDIPLNNISGVCILLVDGLWSQRVSALIVLAVTYIIYFPVFLRVSRCQCQVCIHVVYPFAIVLIGQSFWYSVVWCAYQFVYHGFKHHVEALGQNIFLGISVNGDTIRIFKKGIAQIP